MQVFVAGATGHTGRALVEQARAAGHRVVAHVRPDSSRLAEWTARFEGHGATVCTAPWTAEAMAAALAEHRPSHVFALLGTTRKRMKAEGGDYQAVDFGLTALLIDAAAAAGGVARFVYLSAEGANPGTGNAYLKARVDAEAHLAASGVPWTAARPSFIVGDRDEFRPGEHYGAKAADGLLGLVGVFGGRTLRDRYRSTTSEVLARALLRLAGDPAWANRVARSEDLR
ncbi:MAG: NAD(P)H-binding protein [Myxococcales bacterium]|nr:NAD(P)H-binding protein [Myxococcales bacterium]